MSAELYGSVGGASRKVKKLYANVNGVTREVKSLWANVNGVVRKVYSGAVYKWTYSITGSTSALFSTKWGNSFQYSLYLEIGGDDDLYYSYTEAKYLFSGNLTLLPAGTLIKMHLYQYLGGITRSQVWLNGKLTNKINEVSHEEHQYVSYTVPNDIEIEEIRLVLNGRTWAEKSGGALIVTIALPDGTKFILNNSGTSDQ